mmetsp:Transcript_2978/g.8179  ORF Transcript_2978/g.8179 Transcript_2978/m.8179 type:complete len:382 (-) Transcript_2978:56-1201(-)
MPACPPARIAASQLSLRIHRVRPPLHSTPLHSSTEPASNATVRRQSMAWGGEALCCFARVADRLPITGAPPDIHGTSLANSFIVQQLFVHSFDRSFVRSFICLFLRSLVGWIMGLAGGKDGIRRDDCSVHWNHRYLRVCHRFRPAIRLGPENHRGCPPGSVALLFVVFIVLVDRKSSHYHSLVLPGHHSLDVPGKQARRGVAWGLVFVLVLVVAIPGKVSVIRVVVVVTGAATASVTGNCFRFPLVPCLFHAVGYCIGIVLPLVLLVAIAIAIAIAVPVIEFEFHAIVARFFAGRLVSKCRLGFRPLLFLFLFSLPVIGLLRSQYHRPRPVLPRVGVGIGQDPRHAGGSGSYSCCWSPSSTVSLQKKTWIQSPGLPLGVGP